MIGEARVDTGDTDGAEGYDCSNHLVENLGRVGLETHGHLDLVTPSFGVLASRTLESYVDTLRTSGVEPMSAGRGDFVDVTGDILVHAVIDQLNLVTELLFGVVEAPLDVVN